MIAEVTAAVAALGGAKWLHHRMYHVEPHRIQITHHEVPCQDLAPELDGLVIAQVSDTHITPKVRNREAITNAVRSVKADLYVLTGDMILGQAGIQEFCNWFDALGDEIRPAVAILGNAEHKKVVHTPDIEKALADRNIPLLNNACIQYPIRGTTLQIVGVDDPHTSHSRFAEAFREADPNQFTLVLSHSPDGLAEIGERRADLMLCGHTHGGQIRFPGSGALSGNTKKVKGITEGWYEGDALRGEHLKNLWPGLKVYVSRGLGCSRFGGRLNCPPELPVFTLRCK